MDADGHRVNGAVTGVAGFRLGRWALALIPLVLFLSLALTCYDCTVDDAFISFRCARNLAEGNGPVFNVGERIEAHSNPLWVFILSLCHIVGIDIVTASKIIGLACGAVTLLLLMHICRRTLAVSPGATLVAVCYLAANISFVFFAVSGMETLLYTVSLVLMNYLLIEKREIPAGFACGALTLTRPEGILFAIPLALGCYLNGCRLRKTSIVLLVPIAVYGLMLSLRLLYYGAVFPNSYDAKIGSLPLGAFSLISHARAFYRYTWFSSSMQGPVLFLASMGAIAFLSRKLAPLLGSVAVTAFFVFLSKGDWMSFWRFYTPVLPFLVMYWARTFEFIRPRLVRSSRGKAILVVFLLPLLVNAWDTIKTLDRLESSNEINPAMHSKPHIRAGEYLARIGSCSDVLVVNEIGAIGYYSNLTVIDMLGLTDRHVPSLLRRENLDAYAEYILSRKPAFIMLNDKQAPADTMLHPVHAAIFKRMTETGLYTEEREFALNSFKNLILFVRKESDRSD